MHFWNHIQLSCIYSQPSVKATASFFSLSSRTLHRFILYVYLDSTGVWLADVSRAVRCKGCIYRKCQVEIRTLIFLNIKVLGKCTGESQMKGKKSALVGGCESEKRKIHGFRGKRCTKCTSKCSGGKSRHRRIKGKLFVFLY